MNIEHNQPIDISSACLLVNNQTRLAIVIQFRNKVLSISVHSFLLIFSVLKWQSFKTVSSWFVDMGAPTMRAL